jgi:hypothetical protein
VHERALGGRPSTLDAAPGEHARLRQVRLSRVVDAELTAIAEHEHRTIRAVLRDAVEEYVSAHR